MACKSFPASIFIWDAVGWVGGGGVGVGVRGGRWVSFRGVDRSLECENYHFVIHLGYTHTYIGINIYTHTHTDKHLHVCMHMHPHIHMYSVTKSKQWSHWEQFNSIQFNSLFGFRRSQYTKKDEHVNVNKYKYHNNQSFIQDGPAWKSRYSDIWKIHHHKISRLIDTNIINHTFHLIFLKLRDRPICASNIQ